MVYKDEFIDLSNQWHTQSGSNNSKKIQSSHATMLKIIKSIIAYEAGKGFGTENIDGGILIVGGD